MKTIAVVSSIFAISATVAVAQMKMPDTPASKGYEAAMSKMMSATKTMTMIGDPDKDFVMMMLPHHQGAIDMAKVELEYGKDPMLKKMATEIIAAQQKEIDAMKMWHSKAPM